MRLVIARDGQQVIGFSYGYLLPADTGWWANVDQELPADFVRTASVPKSTVRAAPARRTS
ncbi:hypothetical protein ACFXAZ_15955 [Streptomyces sp. NPDC059477]|uniref:hypothetical protein n=1 Tax=Streptomyces sp. NPDC059477 TaxID=3346847 RepID=UPI0036ABC9A4